MSDKDVALLAREDKIDIAIDLMGYTGGSRTKIFAFRAAPIQIHLFLILQKNLFLFKIQILII